MMESNRDDHEGARRVLVVDDDELSRYVVARRIQRWGFEPLVFASAEAALRYLREGSACALISDVYMPGTSGLALARAARVLHPDLPVLLMTANPDAELVATARADGVRDVIGKQAGADTELRRALECALASQSVPAEQIQLAHSLRTPLTALKSAIDILCDGELPESQRRFAGMAQRNVDRMISLVEKLLAESSARP